MLTADSRFWLVASISISGLFVGMLLLLEAGRRIGNRRLAKDPEGARVGIGAIEAAIFGLMGLLAAFIFGGAAARFDTRRQLTIEEANAIGTAYLRIDLLPADTQPALRDSFRRYADARLRVYTAMPDMDAAGEEMAKSISIQKEIWTRAVAASRRAPAPATQLVLPALNEMIDITTVRTIAAKTHSPFVVVALLFTVILAGALLAGYAMAGTKGRNLVHMIIFAGITALTVYVILDLEYPRMGLIQISPVDQVLVDVRQSMN